MYTHLVCGTHLGLQSFNLRSGRQRSPKAAVVVWLDMVVFHRPGDDSCGFGIVAPMVNLGPPQVAEHAG